VQGNDEAGIEDGMGRWRNSCAVWWAPQSDTGVGRALQDSESKSGFTAAREGRGDSLDSEYLP